MNYVELDLYKHIQSIYKNINHSFLFAYPNQELDKTRAHPVFSQILTYCNVLHSSLNGESLDFLTPNQHIFVQQTVANLDIICDDRQWAYPNDQMSEKRSGSALNSINSSIKNQLKSINILGKNCLMNQTVQFNLITFLSDISCKQYYDYTFKDLHFIEGKSHNSCQMLLSFVESVMSVINSVKTKDNDLNSILTELSQQLKNCKNILNLCYPNNIFKSDIAYKQLTLYMKQWENIKQTQVPALKNYYNKKELLEKYNDTLNKTTSKIATINSPINDDNHDVNNHDKMIPYLQNEILKKTLQTNTDNPTLKQSSTKINTKDDKIMNFLDTSQIKKKKSLF